MAKSLRLIIWLPGETLLDAERVAWVHVTLATDKGLTIYPGHAPTLAETVADQIRYECDGQVHRLDLPAGVLYVRDNVVTLFLAHMVGEVQTMARGGEQLAFDRLARTLIDTASGRRLW